MEENRVFYVDEAGGNDSNCGFLPEEAWKSIEKLNEMVFHAGDIIRLKCGGRWKGMFHPKGSGCRFLPIRLESYGEGDRPEIDGDGAYAGILLESVDFWTVDGIRVCNRAKERKVRQGICIMGRQEGITQGIVIRGCEITEVMGENRRAREPYESMYWNGGIYVTMPGRSSEENHLHDIVIFENDIHDVYTSGIRVNQQEDFINDIHHTHIVVRNNRITRTGSDGIIVANCISPLIDGNICFHAGALGNLEDTQLIAGIWVCATSNALIQRNEVAYTRMFENDGTAFDTDWGTAGDTVFQYNYTHDNQGGFWLDCMKLNYNAGCRGTILRYNISLRDGRGIGVYDQGIFAGFYGNLFFLQEQGEICCFDQGENYHFENNVFFFQKPLKNGWQKASYQGNLYGKLDQGKIAKLDMEAALDGDDIMNGMAMPKDAAVLGTGVFDSQDILELLKSDKKEGMEELLGRIKEALCAFVKNAKMG